MGPAGDSVLVAPRLAGVFLSAGGAERIRRRPAGPTRSTPAGRAAPLQHYYARYQNIEKPLLAGGDRRRAGRGGPCSAGRPPPGAAAAAAGRQSGTLPLTRIAA